MMRGLEKSTGMELGHPRGGAPHAAWIARWVAKRAGAGVTRLTGLIICCVLMVPGHLGLPGRSEAQDRARDEENLSQLIKQTMREFALAVESKDFTEFHRGLAREWREEASQARLAEAYREFTEQDIDLSFVDRNDPRFDDVTGMNRYRRLALRGVYQVDPHRLEFGMSYHLEGDWKLAHLYVRLSPLPGDRSRSRSLPSEVELLELSHDSIRRLADAVEARDFSDFVARGSAAFQQRFLPEDLVVLFEDHVGSGIDLTVLGKQTPELRESPFIYTNGRLVVRAAYDVGSSAVLFELKYDFESWEWKLFAISLSALRSPASPASNRPPTEALISRDL